jgi:hypothetical protein
MTKVATSLYAPRRTPARLCALTTVALINVGPIVQAADVTSYCTELKQVAALAPTREKFASIIGVAREGNFLDSKVSLPGWGDCSFYGTRTYTCDSQGFKTAEEAIAAHGKVFDEVKACLRSIWTEVESRASPGYVVLHDERDSASITINTDLTEKGEHVVRLILFLRSR